MKVLLTLGLAVGIGLLSFPTAANPDFTYQGTSNDDTIYFGYCATCTNPGWLIICRITDGRRTAVLRPMDTGALRIEGGGGNDYIEAIDNDEKEGCQFGDIRNLTYSAVVLAGGDGDDKIYGTPFDDVLWGDSGNDTLVGNEGDDRLYGGAGNDHLIGHSGNDYLSGSSGDDYLSGYGGNDTLQGGTGNDFLLGDQGDDILRGEDGNDILVGGTGLDDIDGGPGTDTFRCRSAASAIAQYDGADAATDCGDTVPRVSIEGVQQRDPYEDWAFMTNNRNAVTYHHFTTSNPLLLLNDRTAGASILISRGGDMPVVGDFDRDGRDDDVAVFRSSTHRWYYDYNHNASTDDIGAPWGVNGDRPIAGDFDRDGVNDDVAIFRPANRTWYYDYNHDGTTNATSGPWGNAGDIPIVGDFFYNQRDDDVAIFRPDTGTWYYDYNHDGSTDFTRGPWGSIGDIPIAGDFDRDGRTDDVGFFHPSTSTWYFNYNLTGSTDDMSGPWGWRNGGEALATTHKQYGSTCGPTSLNMVMEHLGLADHSRRLYFSRDCDQLANPVSSAGWAAGTAVDVGYHLSMEHIMYEGYHRARELDSSWNPGNTNFMDASGRLNTTDGGQGDFFEIQYNIGNVSWNSGTQTTTGRVQRWTEHGAAVGCSDANTSRGLPYVANKFALGTPDAWPVSTSIGGGATFASLDHLKEVIKGFIDHDIPLVVAVESGRHFNTLIGYWERGGSFYVYTADPLDGWGRPFYCKPMRWRKILLGPNALPGGAEVIVGLIFYGHADAGCYGGHPWARDIDRGFGRDTLCGHLP